MQVRISRSAETDLLEGYTFYEQQCPGIGAYFLDSLFADIDALSFHAGVHQRAFGRWHRALAKRFPFAIYYDLVGDRATVIAVLDCRQDPASITQRLRPP